MWTSLNSCLDICYTPNIAKLKASVLTFGLSWDCLELKMCGYNGSVSSVESLHQEVSVLVPDPTVSCLDDPSHLPEQLEDTPILSEDSLEPFDSLAAGGLCKGLLVVLT